MLTVRFAAGLAAANAALTAAGAMRFGFGHDDLMNAHWALTRPWGALLRDTFRIWEVSPVYRPFAELVLKCGYSAFGMNVTAWRICYGMLLCGMAAAVAAAVCMLTRSTLAGATAGVLAGFHPFLGNLYFSMGYVFDVLACTLTCGFLIAYVWARRKPAWTWVVPGLLLILALESKEIAVAALVMAGFYELFVFPIPGVAVAGGVRGNRIDLRGGPGAGPEVDGQCESGVSDSGELSGISAARGPLEL